MHKIEKTSTGLDLELDDPDCMLQTEFYGLFVISEG